MRKTQVKEHLNGERNSRERGTSSRQVWKDNDRAFTRPASPFPVVSSKNTIEIRTLKVRVAMVF